MSNWKKINQVIWAVDPFNPPTSLDPDTLQEFNKLMEVNKIAVSPVYVFSPFGDIEKLAKEKIANNIRVQFSDMKVTIKTPYVLTRSPDSKKSTAACLLDHAKDIAADLIVVSSHGHTGFDRLLFGSFAERLLNTSPIPLIFMNQKTRASGASFENALWATDLSSACEAAFDTFLIQARDLCKEIVLYNDVSIPWDVRTYYSEWDVRIPPADDLVEQLLSLSKQQASDWLERARKHQFKVRTAIEFDYLDVSNRILAVARESASGLIVMASKAGPFEAMILGSHARDVFRKSEFPVWIYGPQFREYADMAKEGR